MGITSINSEQDYCCVHAQEKKRIWDSISIPF